MGGLAVLFLLGLYFVLSVIAVVKVKPLWAKGVVLLVALLLPTADAVYGRYKLKQMCAAEGGLKVYRVAENVQGFAGVATSDVWIKEYGFQFSEGERAKGKYYRISKQNNQIIVEENITPKSQYQVISVKTRGKAQYWKNAYVVQDMQGEVLAEDTQISFRGGWAERFLGQFSGAGAGAVASCANRRFETEKLTTTILKPSGE